MSTARYGDGSLYGAPSLTYGAHVITNRRLSWAFIVDWDNDGIYDGSNEAGAIYDLQTENGRPNFLKGTGDGFEPVSVGRVTLQMRNNDGRYDPYNTSSPLYGNLLPGRRYQLSVLIEDTATVHPVMVGRIDDIRPIYGDVDNVRITLSNGVKQMEHEVRTNVYENIRYDDALAVLLADWEYGYDIDTTLSEVMRYWWARGDDLFDEINEIVNAALGMFNIAEDGTAVYRSRVSSDTPLLTLDGTDIEKEYGVRTPVLWEAVKNVINVYARARAVQTNVELWRMSDVVLIGTGETKTIWANFSFNGDEGVALVVTTPVITTDYLAFANSDGTGTNLSANISITITKFATSAKMVITNTGTSGYITLLKIRGNAIVADKYTYVEERDEISIDEFGEFKFIVQSDWLQDVNTAVEEAEILVSRLSNARQFPRVMMKPNPEKQFALRVFGLALLNISSKNISGEFRIGYYKHSSMDETLQAFQTELYFEPNLLSNTGGSWIFPATFGTTTVF